MKTFPASTRPAQQADPKIVKKTRRDNATYASFGSLRGEQNQDYMHQQPGSPQSPQPPRLLEFGRPGL